MGLAKSENFTDTQNDLANVAKALSHPARIAILQELLLNQVCSGSEIVRIVPLAQPTVSRHLRELKAAGLINSIIEGNKVNYCISPERKARVRAVLTELVNFSVFEKTSMS